MEVIYGLIVSLVAALVVSLALGGRRPWKSLAALFAVVFLSVWSLGLWMAPFGPHWGQLYWLPFLFAAIIVILIVMAMAPQPPPANKEERNLEEKEEVEAARGLGVFFWILAVIAIVMIFLRYTGNWLPSIR